MRDINNVIVLIPHYNNPMGLIKSLKSIGMDENVDILIVDDGSKNLFEESAVKLSFKANGEVHFIYLKQNQGIEVALNTGLKHIKNKAYKYVARLDCDDLCSKNRFNVQSTFLDANPDIYLVGSFVRAISPDGKFLYNIKMPTSHEKIKEKMYYNTMFIHPTVMFRTKAIDTVGYYPSEYPAAEDYAYFFKFLQNFKTAVLPDYLVDVQMDDTGISAQKRDKQVASRINIIRKNYYFGYYPVTGLIRSYILLYVPRSILKKLKVLLFR